MKILNVLQYANFIVSRTLSYNIPVVNISSNIRDILINSLVDVEYNVFITVSTVNFFCVIF